MKKILLIATGGTIACQKTEEGLSPALSSEELLSYVPQASSFCHIETAQLMQIDSTDMQPHHYVSIASKIQQSYESYDGFVIAHGTDTMAYTAAALSYLIQNSEKPIVLTGSQQPMNAPDTDARTNLLDSLYYASYGAPCVCIVFSGKVILGTRAHKMSTKSFDAFESINFPIIARVRNEHLITYIRPEVVPGGPRFYLSLSPDIFVMKLIPGSSADILLTAAQKSRGVILESYGVGGLPSGGSFEETLRQLIQEGKTVVLSTQAMYEGSDISVYHSGFMAKSRLGLLESYDMTLEAVVLKLMWILGQTSDPARIRELFLKTVSYDMLSQDTKPVEGGLG